MSEPTILISLFSNIWSIFLIILFFGGSIFIHELGHFLAAQHRGLIVERFSIGFGPKIIHWKRNGVEYCISLLPLGGYVALPQLADMQSIEGESKIKKKDLPPISFIDKLIVSSMGVIFNLLFAFLLACIVWIVGLPSSEDEQTTIIGYIQPTLPLDSLNALPIKSPAAVAGLKPGDKILKIDDHPIHSFSELKKQIVMGTYRDQNRIPLTVFTVQRNNETLTIPVNPALIKSNPHTRDEFRFVGISPYHKITLRENPTPSSPAYQAGIKAGDSIIAMNGETLYSSARLSEELQNFKNIPIDLTIQRNNQILHKTVTPVLLDISKSICLLSNIHIQSLEDLPKKPQAATIAFLPNSPTHNRTPTSLKIFSQFYVLETYPPDNPYLHNIKPLTIPLVKAIPSLLNAKTVASILIFLLPLNPASSLLNNVSCSVLKTI
jgi:regulator of sigma E protease